ncbi:MFS transporter [Roseiterribacter gracilis]|uniref:MFS transporter n=1 Tax=Roseiterribacter gracilis TaxID=2812848 RepID=A0A8S8XDT7_9PROT|nr:MFS transporter [Rhodospirillales bacterium TMPK1]
MVNVAAAGGSATRGMTAEERKVIFASSLGTVFEWYDFYLYGSLAAAIGNNFFSALDPGSRDIFTLLAFAAGFFVRPFGAIVFGRLGDLVGRKYTFLVTIMLMGLSTFLVGCLPSYASVGIAAPVLLISLRLIQGLALGGEYGGAATYVAEHAPDGRRGAYTAWIQTTATLGLFLSLLVIIVVRETLAPADFDAWGWRIPFLLSALLLAVSVWIRLKLSESPVFQRMKNEGTSSKAPLKESFGHWPNLKIVILALFGLVAGQAVVWYTGQFYAMQFLTTNLKVPATTAQTLIAIALAIGTPFFIVFGSLSDKYGRKPIILAGCVLAIVTYFPIFQGLTHFANPALEAATTSSPVTVVADPNECEFQFNWSGTIKFTSSCDVATAALYARGVPYTKVDAPKGTVATIKIGDKAITSYDAKGADAAAKAKTLATDLGAALKEAKYPATADVNAINKPMIVLLLVVLMIYVTMVYGPIAALLVEFFPARIRYTSMSLPYHIGNGWLGGFLPAIAAALVLGSGNLYSGLWYPIIVAAITVVLGVLFVREPKHLTNN